MSACSKRGIRSDIGARAAGKQLSRPNWVLLNMSAGYISIDIEFVSDHTMSCNVIFICIKQHSYFTSKHPRKRISSFVLSADFKN